MVKDSSFSQEVSQLIETRRAELKLPLTPPHTELIAKSLGVLSLLRSDGQAIAPIFETTNVPINYRRFVAPAPGVRPRIEYMPYWIDEFIGGWQIINEPDPVNPNTTQASAIAILVSGNLDGRGRYSAFDIINAMYPDDIRRKDNVQIPLEVIDPKITEVEDQPLVIRWRQAIRNLVRQAQFTK
jgi:hypothetical protein